MRWALQRSSCVLNETKKGDVSMQITFEGGETRTCSVRVQLGLAPRVNALLRKVKCHARDGEHTSEAQSLCSARNVGIARSKHYRHRKTCHALADCVLMGGRHMGCKRARREAYTRMRWKTTCWICVGYPGAGVRGVRRRNDPCCVSRGVVPNELSFGAGRRKLASNSQGEGCD